MRNKNLAGGFRNQWLENIFPMFEYASKSSYKVTGISTVDIMDVVRLVYLCIFNLWISNSNSSRILLETFVNMVELAGSL